MTINFGGKMGSFEGRGQLAWSGHSERSITEGSWSDEDNETIGGI